MTRYHRVRVQLSRRGSWILAILATLTMTVSILDRQTLSILAPTVTKYLEIDETAYGFLGSAFSLAYLVFAPIAGQLIDRFGARRSLLVAILVWSCVAAAHALVPSFAVLFALRIALGIAESPSFPGASQTVHRALSPKDRPRGFGMILFGSALAGVVGPPLVTVLNARLGWRLAFLGSTAIALGVWLPLWRLFAFAPAARAALDTPPQPGPAAASTVGFGDLLRHRAMIRMFVAMAGFAPATAFWNAWAAKLLVAHYGIGQNDVGRWLWIIPVFSDAGLIVFADLASRFAAPRRLFAIATLLGAVVAFFGLTQTPAAGMTLAAVSSFGIGGYVSLMNSQTFAEIPAAAVSRAGGLFASAQSLCFIIIYPILGHLIDALHGYNEVMVIIGLALLPGGAFFVLHRR